MSKSRTIAELLPTRMTSSSHSPRKATLPNHIATKMSDAAPPASEKEPWNPKSKEKFETYGISHRSSALRLPKIAEANPLRSKSKSEFYDPCQEAAQRSYKCLYRNGGDKSMCGEYFQYVGLDRGDYVGVLTVCKGV